MSEAPRVLGLCPSCTRELPADAHFCSHCGAAISSVSQMPTGLAGPAENTAKPGAVANSPAVGRLISSDSIPVGGFTPGAILAERYRIIGLLGRGGMGDVYRADDLKLGQPVALKFLPKTLSEDPVRRERFIAEVRIARQVSHPNICRVYDIGELENQHFLSMEYIDGEDLASLLKRIGHLHSEKALDIARQLCAGLAAAHDKGVLHRDLKPANVMIDGRGRVRITDFGLALAAGEESPSGEVSGTPAYMAPEQLAGKGSSVRSDIYALGLVLYELYTGRKTFQASTLAELRARKESETPTAPSEITRDLDPVVERVILRCIEKDPRARPPSVAQVVAALPGGDPLAAALAAGETPSPEMVAASGSSEGLAPKYAWLGLAFVVVALIAVAHLGAQSSLLRRVPFEKKPDVLEEKAREVLKKLGYQEEPADWSRGLQTNFELLTYVLRNDKSRARWENLPTDTVRFWYRHSPQPIERRNYLPPAGAGPFPSDPPLSNSGEALLWLDTRGRVLGLEVVPPELDRSARAASQPDWSVLLQEAGLDLSRLTATEPEWTPNHHADTRAAWLGSLPERGDVQIRIEAAAYRGKPVFFRRIGPWTKPSRMEPHQPTMAEQASNIIGTILLGALLVGGSLFARRNLRLGRGDRRGAARLAIFIFGLGALVWILSEKHVSNFHELFLVMMFLGWNLFISGVTWVLYVALEPFVRRRMPGTLVSWSRLISGEVRDPLVGRDILVGCVASVSLLLLDVVGRLLPGWLGYLPEMPMFLHSRPVFMGSNFLLSLILAILTEAIFIGLAFLFLLFLCRVLLRKEWLAVTVYVLILTSFLDPFKENLLIYALFSLLGSVLFAFLLLRIGLLATIAALLFQSFFYAFPITTQLSAWYSGIGFVGLFILLALTTYGFYTSLGGRTPFAARALED